MATPHKQDGARAARAPLTRPIAVGLVVAFAALGAQGGCRVTTGLQVSHAGSTTPPAAVAHANGSGVTTSGLDPTGPAAPGPAAPRTDVWATKDLTPVGRATPLFVSEIIPHDKLLTLRGMTVEQATQRLRQLGFVGTVNVYNHGAFMEGCTDDQVCFTQPSDGLELKGNIDLYMNAKLTIAPPPP